MSSSDYVVDSETQADRNVPLHYRQAVDAVNPASYNYMISSDDLTNTPVIRRRVMYSKLQLSITSLGSDDRMSLHISNYVSENHFSNNIIIRECRCIFLRKCISLSSEFDAAHRDIFSKSYYKISL